MSAFMQIGIRISKHLQNVYEEGELDESATVSKKETVQNEGSRSVTRQITYYNLDAVISVGYRVNSIRATQFRRWATQVLRQYAITGYVLDRKRMENGAFLGEDYHCCRCYHIFFYANFSGAHSLRLMTLSLAFSHQIPEYNHMDCFENRRPVHYYNLRLRIWRGYWKTLLRKRNQQVLSSYL